MAEDASDVPTAIRVAALPLREALRGTSSIPAGALPTMLAIPTLVLSLAVIVGWGFNGLYGQDPYAYFGFAVGPFRHFLLGGEPLTPIFWPLGYPFPVTLVSLALGPVPLAGQSVSLIAALAAVALTYALGREVLIQAGADPALARRTGVAAALFLGVSGGMVQASVEVMPDGLALATALLSAWALLRWSRSERDSAGIAWATLTGGALAWSIVTRWGQLLLVPIWVLLAASSLRPRLARSRRAIAMSFLAAGMVLGAQIWLILTVAPDPRLGGLPFAGNFSLQPGQWSPLHLVQRRFLNSDGLQEYSLPNILYYASLPFRLRYLSPLLAPSVLAGLVLVLRRYRNAVPALVLWPAVVLLFDAGLTWQNPRFALPALPPLALLAGLACAWTWEVVSSRRRFALSCFMLIAVLAVAAGGLKDTGRLVAARQANLDVARWAAASIPAGALILSFDITETLSYETRLRPRDLYLLSRAQLARLVSTQPTYLLVQVEEMGGQWRFGNPGADFRFLRHGPGLVREGDRGSYTLFRVRRP